MSGVRATVSSGQGVTRRLREIQERLSSNLEVAIGLPASSGSHPDSQMTYAKLGAIHEFGTRNIPERSFLRVPLRAAQDELAGHFRRLMPKVARGEMTIMQALDQIGARAASIPQEAIQAGIAPPNAPSTVRQKGSSNPLIDTGAMRQAITWVIREKGL